jgi:hypothetical protein
MWLNNDSGKETVTIAGLVEGTELSLVQLSENKGLILP